MADTFFGSTYPPKIFFGSQAVKEVYFGSTKVWPRGALMFDMVFILPDGLMQQVNGPGGVVVRTNWYTPTTANIGTQHWITVTHVAQAHSSQLAVNNAPANPNVRVSLSAQVIISLGATIYDGTGSFRVDFYTQATGGAPVHSTTFKY